MKTAAALGKNAASTKAIPMTMPTRRAAMPVISTMAMLDE